MFNKDEKNQGKKKFGDKRNVIEKMRDQHKKKI